MGVRELFELKGRVALITGGSRGLGLQIAQGLGEMGAKIAISARKPAELEDAKTQLAKQGIDALTVVNDLTKPEQVPALVDAVVTHHGTIDILVNNAGVNWFGTVLEVTEENWDFVMDVNAKAVFFASQAVLPAMIAQKSGVIVNLASMAGKIGSANNLPYNASKAAVISITKSLALAHAADGVRVNCVCPGFVETDMWTTVSAELGALSGVVAEEFTRRRLATVPLGRMERAEDVANVIGFLASSKAAYMTGQAISVDGGLVMH
jgi:gluconate 5-dehydrogenase